MDLNGKKALVTGGSRGIGRAIALRFAIEGADVAITYNASPGPAEEIVKEIENTGRNGFAIRADASRPEDLKEPTEEAIRKLGGIDILVNNAGTGRFGTLGELPPEDFHYQLHLNVLGVYEHTRVAQKHMKAGGRILIISSILGERGIGPGMWSYNASKFAATGFGRSIAHDLGERNITVNIIQPGPIDTDLNPASESSGMEQMTALKRYGKPEEVAALASFLASEESSYITGATINVDGGMNA